MTDGNIKMEITPENIDLFARNNLSILKMPVRGIVLEFHGLNYTEYTAPLSGFAEQCAHQGVIYLFPFYGPWSWMNNTAVKMIDRVIDAVFEKYGLPEKTPIISTGGSMGGQGALIYSLYAKRMPNACAANCPVCDLVFHYAERDDLPRSVYSAFSSYECGMAEAVRSASPLHMVDQMPKIDYYIVHGDKDTAVLKGIHSDVFVKALSKEHSVIYDEVEGMEHCALSGIHWANYENFILGHI